MIQMRWAIAPAGSGRGLLGGSGGQMFETVLQFRYRSNMAEEDLQAPIWSEWKDAAAPGKEPT